MPAGLSSATLATHYWHYYSVYDVKRNPGTRVPCSRGPGTAMLNILSPVESHSYHCIPYKKGQLSSYSTPLPHSTHSYPTLGVDAITHQPPPHELWHLYNKYNTLHSRLLFLNSQPTYHIQPTHRPGQPTIQSNHHKFNHAHNVHLCYAHLPSSHLLFHRFRVTSQKPTRARLGSVRSVHGSTPTTTRTTRAEAAGRCNVSTNTTTTPTIAAIFIAVFDDVF
jgi:hypothetical protein